MYKGEWWLQSRSPSSKVVVAASWWLCCHKVKINPITNTTSRTTIFPNRGENMVIVSRKNVTIREIRSRPSVKAVKMKWEIYFDCQNFIYLRNNAYPCNNFLREYDQGLTSSPRQEYPWGEKSQRRMARQELLSLFSKNFQIIKF